MPVPPYAALGSCRFWGQGYHSCMAMGSGMQGCVWPERSSMLRFTSSRPSRIVTTLSCPFTAAYQSGVWPYSSGMLGLTSSRPSSIFSTPSCSLEPAHQSGVWPYLSGLLGLTSSRPSNISTTPSCPLKAAHRAVFRRRDQVRRS